MFFKMQYLKDILLKDLTPAQLKEVDAGVKALIESSEKRKQNKNINKSK
tara:strand:+ start:1461 stop:1607 length:147 start_codon:yes stop_codon:yes gene_type:complete